MAGARHGMCELTWHSMAGERLDMSELTFILPGICSLFHDDDYYYYYHHRCHRHGIKQTLMGGAE
jgi:hypothetical protein